MCHDQTDSVSLGMSRLNGLNVFSKLWQNVYAI
mgnify:CR=1 FL=1